MNMIRLGRACVGEGCGRAVSRTVGGTGVVIILLAAGCSHSVDQASSAPAVQPNELRTMDPGDTDWIKQKAKESGGDYRKLSSDDQTRLNQMTNGRGYIALKQYAPK